MKILALLSGGIDSPVAAYLMAKAGAEILPLHMDNRPYSDSRDRVLKIVARLREVTGQEMHLYLAPHGEVNLTEIEQTRNPHIRCVLCKRFMLRIAEGFAHREGCGALVMGDSLGQVASQTLRNILIEQEAIKIPIIRPLIGLDKLEIIKIAKSIDTYDISIENASSCEIAPKKPSTHALIEKVRDAEAEMNVKAMIERCLDNIMRL